MKSYNRYIHILSQIVFVVNIYGGRDWSAIYRQIHQYRLSVFLLATRVAEGRGVLDAMAVSTLPAKMRPK